MTLTLDNIEPSISLSLDVLESLSSVDLKRTNHSLVILQSPPLRWGIFKQLTITSSDHNSFNTNEEHPLL